jgi:hypothetical protein
MADEEHRVTVAQVVLHSLLLSVLTTAVVLVFYCFWFKSVDDRAFYSRAEVDQLMCKQKTHLINFICLKTTELKECLPRVVQPAADT